MSIYLDHQNQTPLCPEAEAALQEAIRRLGNPSSPHAEGRAAKAALEKARSRTAALVGARSEEIVFTSGGTEANLWALTGLCAAAASKGRSPSTRRRLVLSSIEHLSLLQTARRMEKEGWTVTLLPVDSTGRVDPDRLEDCLSQETVLVSIQWANGEIGTLQPIAELARRVKRRGVLFHTDAIAAAGQVAVDLRNVPADALSLAANTFGGPPGVGALVLRNRVRIAPLLVGGIQEEGLRAGTENLLGIVGMGAAADSAVRRIADRAGQLIPLRDRLIRGILDRMPQAQMNGHPTERLPGHVSVSFPGLEAERLVLALDLEGVAVGLGSACSSRTLKASHVLKAVGVETSLALGTITCTLGSSTTEAEINRFLEILPGAAAQAAGDVGKSVSVAGS